MSIYIRSEFLDYDRGVFIETRNNEEPVHYTDIVGVEFGAFPDDMDRGMIFYVSYELFQAYQKQKKADEEYAIIDRLVEVSVKDDEIYIKYDMDNEIKETTFEGGFDLLREWKLKDYK